MKKKTEPNKSLQTISCSVTVAAEPLCVPPHEMSDLKRSAKMKSYRTRSGHTFSYERQAVPDKDKRMISWHDAWATVHPAPTEERTLENSWSILIEIAEWLKSQHIDQSFRIIIGWDKAVRPHQGQIFKIFEPADQLDFVISCPNAEDYRAARTLSLAPLPGWQKDVFKK